MGDDKNSRSGMRSYLKFYSSSIFVGYIPRPEPRRVIGIVQILGCEQNHQSRIRRWGTSYNSGYIIVMRGKIK